MPLIDHTTLNELREALGDELDGIVKLYVEGLPQQSAQLADLLAAGDLTTLRRSAHSLKGSSSSLGAARMGARAAEIEKLAATGQTSEALRLAVEAMPALAAETAAAFVESGWINP